MNRAAVSYDMPTNDVPTWEDTLPDQTPVTAPPAPPAATGEPSWEDTTPDVAPSPLPDFKIKLTPEQELQQKGLWEPGMGPLSGPNTPEDTARELRALPQALEIPFAVLGKTVAAGARTVRDVLNPMTYLPPDQRPRPFVIDRASNEMRPMTDEEIAARDPLQQGKPIFQFPRTQLNQESFEGQRMIEGLLTPENLALLPEAGGRAGAAALLAATAPGLVQQITQVVRGGGTEEQKRDAVNSLLIPALLMTRAHAFPEGRAVTTPGDLTESMQVPPPITLTGGEIPGRPKGAPAPIVPPTEIARATPEKAAAAASRMQRTATAAFEPRVGPPEVPITPAEVREDVISTIRKAGARTRGEIQKLFPGRQLSREEAGQLRDQAWPADVDERAIQQAEATRQANAAAEQARRARIMAPATSPTAPRPAEPLPQPTTAEDFIKMSPAEVVKWKTAIGYGPQDPARIAAGMTASDVPKLLTEISRLRQDEVRIRNQMETAVNARDEARLNQLMQEHGPVSLKAQTLREIAEELSKSPPEEEQVTLYQGQGAEGGGGSDTRFFTKNPERAATYGPDVYRVTVPKSVADAAAAAAKKEGSGTTGDYVLPQEWVKKAEKMPSPTKQVVHEIPTGEEPPAAPAAPEAKYLEKPLSYWENIIENLPKGTERERLARSLGVANQPAKIIQYLRKRINDMRAVGVKPAKISFAAYIPPGQTVPEVGANHPEILKRLGVPGFETPESRNTPQFGFTDEEGNFLTREQAAERAKLTGQDLKEFEPGEPAHSDEIASPTEPTKPISEAKPPVPAETAPAASAVPSPVPAEVEESAPTGSEAPAASEGGTVSMGPGAAARAEFEEGPPSIEASGVDRLEMPAWDLAMAKYRNLKEGIAQLFTRRTTKADFSLISNAIYNIPRYFGQIAAKSLRLRANDVERRAVTFLMQALKMSGDGLSADDAERLGQLEHAGDPTGYLKTRGFDMKTAAEQFRNEGKKLNAAAAEQAAQAMAIALEKYNQLLPIARRARRQFDAQLTREANAGIDTEYENWYVPQRHDLDLMPTANRPIVLGDPRGGGSQAFQKAKVFEDYATAIEKGFVPRSLDIADLLEHRVNQGERMVQKKIFFDKLANYKDPVDGNPLVTKIPKRVIKRPDGDIRVQEHIPRGYEAIEPMPGIRLAVHKGYARLIRALTGNSQIGESALVGALQDLAAVEKHLGLALDTFHASRTLQAELALTGRVSIGSRLKRGEALVEYHPRDLDLAVKQGLITQQMADWVTKRNPMQVGGRELELSPYQIVNIGARNGLQMARVADVMYREWTRQIPISGAVNKWVFDKMTRSAISQAFVQEFERVAKNNPHLNANGVGRMVAREINTFFGNIGKEGIFKNPSLSTLNQIIWLAPKWVEALATREARAAKQAGEIPFKLARGEQITIPTTLKGIGTGLGAYFVATQLLNLFTRHQFTFQNQEEGHKLDAWIPDVTGKTRGFFISPLSVFGEITHDVIRYAREKPDFATAVATILSNKLGNLARAGEILASGRDPVSGEKLLGSARRALTAAVQLVPAPISLSQVGRGIGHELFPGAVPAPAPGAVQRQLTSTIGFKTEPAGSAQQQVFNMVDAWKRSSPNHKIRYQLEQRQKQDFGPSDYRDMRNALIRGDLSQASRAYDKLLENRTPKDIRQTLEHPHPFTGSKQYERAFVSSLTPEQRQTYQAAIQERRALARTFEDMLRQRYANQRQVGAPSALSP